MHQRQEWMGTAGLGRGGRVAPLIVAIVTGLVLLVGCDLLMSDASKVERAADRMSQGDYSRAMVDLKTVLSDSPDNAAARLLLGDVSIRVGETEAGLKELDRALALGADPADVSPLRYRALVTSEQYAELLHAVEQEQALPSARRALLVATAYAGLGRSEEAGRAFEKALSLAPDDPAILVAQARFLAASGQWEAAEGSLAKALALRPDLAEAWAVKGTMDFFRGRNEAARDSLAKATDLGRTQLTWPEQLAISARLFEAHLGLQDREAAARALKAISARWPNYPQTHYLTARLAASQQDYGRAVAEVRKALQRAPGNPAARLLLGASLLASGQLGQAEAELSSLFYEFPENLEARKLLAQVYLATNRPSDARDLLSDADASLDTDARLQWLLGAAFLATGSSKAGVERLEKAVVAEPANSRLRMDLAGVYLVAGRSEDARALLEEVPAAEGGARLQHLKVLVATRGASPAEARAEVEKLVRDNPDDPALLANAAAFLIVATVDTEQARQWLTKSVSIDPSQASARFALAALELQQGRAEESDAQLRAIIENDPKNERAYLALAQNAAARGDNEQAGKLLEQAIGTDPSAIESRLQLARLAYVSGRAKEGRSLLEQAVTVAPDKAEVNAAAGKVLIIVGQYDDALIHLRRAIDAGSVIARLDAARAYWGLGQKDQARAILNSGLNSTLKWLEGLALLSELDARDGRVEAALTRVREARKQGGFPLAGLDMIEGDIRMIASQPGEAAVAYQRAAAQAPSAALAIKTYFARKQAGRGDPEAPLVGWLQRFPGDAPTRRALAAYYMEAGQRPRAIREYEILAASAVTVDAVTLNNLAWLYQEVGDRRAVETASRARSLAPSAPAVLDTYGWILVQNGRSAEAVEVLQTAHQKLPKNAEIRYHLARAYAETGNRDRAISQLEDALAAQGRASWRPDAERLLAELTR